MTSEEIAAELAELRTRQDVLDQGHAATSARVSRLEDRVERLLSLVTALDAQVTRATQLAEAAKTLADGANQDRTIGKPPGRTRTDE